MHKAFFTQAEVIFLQLPSGLQVLSGFGDRGIQAGESCSSVAMSSRVSHLREGTALPQQLAICRWQRHDLPCCLCTTRADTLGATPSLQLTLLWAAITCTLWGQAWAGSGAVAGLQGQLLAGNGSIRLPHTSQGRARHGLCWVWPCSLLPVASWPSVARTCLLPPLAGVVYVLRACERKGLCTSRGHCVQFWAPSLKYRYWVAGMCSEKNNRADEGTRKQH